MSHSKPTFLVTGGSGYLASWIVKQLLEQGHTVHTTVRSLSDGRKVQPLKNLPQQEGQLKFFEADLLKEGSFLPAMQGCDIVIHTASPFVISGFKDPQKALIDPAVQGTRNVLSSVNQTASVKRVVLTSSVAAMYGDNQDARGLPNQTITEQHWNTSSSLDHQPYSYSKVLAEKAAWEMQKAQSRWDMVVINPSMIYGPSLTPASGSTSLDTFAQIASGTLRFGAPHLTMGMVDVRDTAAAHVQAALKPEASGRYIVSNREFSLLEVGQLMRPFHQKPHLLPTRYLPKRVIWLMAPLLGLTRKFIETNVAWPLKFDHSRSIRELNLQYRPFEETLKDQYQQWLQQTQKA